MTADRIATEGAVEVADSPFCDEERPRFTTFLTPPSIFANPSTIMAMPNVSVSANVSAQAGSGGAVTLTCVNPPPGSTFPVSGSSGTFTWTPTWSQIRSWPVTFQATDPAGNSASAQVTINVIDSGPYLSVSPSTTQVGPNVAVHATITASSPSPATALTLACTNPPAGSTFNASGGTGTFSWTPSWSQFRSWPLTFLATDPAGVSAATQMTVNVVDSGPSIMVSPSSAQVAPNVAVQATVSAYSSSPGSPLTITCTNPPPNSTFSVSGNTGTFSWTPSWSQVRSWPVTFQVTDPAGLNASTQMTINVSDPGPYVVANPGSESATVGQAVMATVSAMSMSPGATYTWVVLNKPATATFNPSGSSGSFSWTPSAPGTAQVTFQATDPAGMTGQATLLITVLAMRRTRPRPHTDGAPEGPQEWR